MRSRVRPRVKGATLTTSDRALHRLGDFRVGPRLFSITALAVPVGAPEGAPLGLPEALPVGAWQAC